LLFQPVKRACIDYWIGANTEGKVVAAELAFVPNAASDPPHCRMKKEERLDECLHQVPDEITTSYVGELVGQNDFKLIRAERSGG